MAEQGEPHTPRLLTPGVAVVVGYVLLVGNPWLGRDLTVALYSTDSAIRLFDVLFTYPAWHVDVERVGPFLFWFANLRTMFFVALTVAGLPRVSRWVSETAGNLGLFVTTVGLTALSAVSAGLAAAVLGVTVLDTSGSLPFNDINRPEEFLLIQFSASAMFGVLFGLVLGGVAVMQRRAPVSRERKVDAPKSLW